MARDIKKKLDANGCSFGHLTLILLLHYLVKYKSRLVIKCCWRVASTSTAYVRVRGGHFEHKL